MKPSGFSAKTNGIYRKPAHAGQLLVLANQFGLDCVAIDLQAVRDKHALLDAFARSFRFPESFGDNWDALADCLQDLSWLPSSKGWVLMLHGVTDFAAAVPDAYDVLLDTLIAVADGWKRQDRVFVVWADAPAGLPVFPVK